MGPRTRRVLVEWIPLVLWLVLFLRLESAAGKDVTAATAHAHTLQAVERALHVNVELSLNRWLAGQVVLSHLAVYVYRLYYVPLLAVLVWVFVRHAEVYRQVRRTLVAMMALILSVYWLVPMSPPRFALPGITDIVARYDIVGHVAGQNHYSAMPSLHVGWSLWCAYAVWSARPRLGLLPWLFPVLMATVVLTTGNHYVLDVVGSVILVSAAILVAKACGRLLSAGGTTDPRVLDAAADRPPPRPLPR